MRVLFTSAAGLGPTACRWPGPHLCPGQMKAICHRAGSGTGMRTQNVLPVAPTQPNPTQPDPEWTDIGFLDTV